MMKKAIHSWKIWTILSAIIFFLTCWLAVFAASSLTKNSSYTERQTTSSDKVLDESEWNILMDKLQYDAIPAWAIMAFADRTSCPDWWVRYTDADWRFLMGSSYDFWKAWGNSLVTLTVNNIPPHQHYIRFSSVGNFWDNSNTRPIVVDRETNKFPTAWKDMTNESNNLCFEEIKRDWDMKCASQQNGNTNWKYGVRTSPDIVWVSETKSVNILNPYVRVLYCRKS